MLDINSEEPFTIKDYDTITASIDLLCYIEKESVVLW